jgi:uncharacterized membrane protein
LRPQILSNPDRPEIKDLKFTGLDIICEVAAVLLLIMTWAAAVHYYNSLPRIVPHFNLSERSDNWDSKASVFSFPTVMTMIYFLLLGTNFISPRLFNYPVQITPANARAQYTLARRTLSVIKVWVMAVFVHITFSDMGIAWGVPGGIGLAALLIVFGSIVAIYWHLAKRAQ